MPLNLQAEFGNIDIYLFDQLLRGRIRPGMRVLDAGCGGGRNLVFLLRQGCDVAAVDEDSAAIASVMQLASTLAPQVAPAGFRVEPVESMSFEDASMDVVLSSAVLHFARSSEHWEGMVREMWRVLRPGGLLFARLASTIGIADRIVPLGQGRYRLPDGSDRYLVDEAILMSTTQALQGVLLDPLKTTVVQGQRAMTTWVVKKINP